MAGSCSGRGALAACFGVFVLLAAGAGGTADLIQTVDYSDTFTVAEQGGPIAERTDGSFNTGLPAYNVEDAHGNPQVAWTPRDQFSFNTGLSSTCCGYPSNNGNAGAAGGVAQSGGTDFSFAYGLRTSYLVQMDAIFTFDRIDISSLTAPGAGIGSGLSVFFRNTGGLSLYNGATDTPVTDSMGVPVNTGLFDDGKWHNFAVHFDQDTGTLKIFVDRNLAAAVDLNTFAGGIYRTFSNGAVGAGGAGYDFANRVLWVDNFQVGEPTGLCFSATPRLGPAPLAVAFDGSCSSLPAGIQSTSWDFGDGQSGTGATFEHTYAVGDRYQATLTVKETGGATSSISTNIIAYDSVASTSDDFERPDGGATGWTAFNGLWAIQDGQVVGSPPVGVGETQWLWAGDPPVIFPERINLEFDMSFLTWTDVATNGVGRHGGIGFCGTRPSARTYAGWSGYTIDWIDRASDHGLRLTRVDSGALQPAVVNVAAAPAEPPLTVRVEITGQVIRVFGDDVLYLETNDATYRGGFAGFWMYQAAGPQTVAFDNFSATVPANPLTACFTAAGPEALTTPGDEIAFDAACTENVGTGTINSYAWDFGDGATATGATATHTYTSPDVHEVTLTVRDTLGNQATATKRVFVYQATLNYSDDFERADGAITGWTVYSVPDTWNILSGELVTGPTTEERWIWAGDPPVIATKNATYAWDQTFAGPGTDAVIGRHAGFAFCANQATHRTAAGFTGYFVDWIDRTTAEADRGPRLTRVDNGVLTEIIRGQANLPAEVVPAEPPLLWEVEVEDDHIRLLGDGVPIFDVIDNTYRGGLFGFWTYALGQELAYDNLSVTGQSLTAFYKSTATALTVTQDSIVFDGTLSEAFGAAIDSYEWEFGDGATASGAQVSHVFEFAGSYGVSLTVRSGARSDTFERSLTVGENLLPFADCFDRTAGPVDGWTVALGDWTITAGGALETITAGAEAFLWAGSPPLGLPTEFVAEVDWTFLAATDVGVDGVGRHAGINFYFNNPTENRFAADSRGYNVFYIDRAADRGLNLLRFAGGAYVTLVAGTPAFTEPPAKIRIEIDGSHIKVYADGALAIDVEDSTYRDGYFGVHVYSNNEQVDFDNILVGQTELPTCEDIPQQPKFWRADPNNDGACNITDGIYILNYLFLGGPGPTCRESADANNDKTVNITDGIYVLNYLFLGGPAPLPPGPPGKGIPCGVDPDAAGSPGDLGCAVYTKC